MKKLFELENKINALWNRFDRECDEIAGGCAEEGYPSRGSNYELRVERLWENYYKDEMGNLYDTLEEERKGHLFVSLCPDLSREWERALINTATNLAMSLGYEGIAYGDIWWNEGELHVLVNEWSAEVDIHTEWVIHPDLPTEYWWVN